MKRKQGAGKLVWLILPLLILWVGCNKAGGPQSTEQGQPGQVAASYGQDRADATTSKQSPKAGAQQQPGGSRQAEEETLGKYQFPHKTDAVNRPLAASLPRKVVYKGLRFTVTQGTISDVPQPGKKRRADADHIYAYLNISIHNEQESTTFSGVSPTLLKLQLSEDEFGSPLTEDWNLELKPRATEKVTLVFAVPKDATWKQAVLVVSQAQEEPATLALDGPVPVPVYPIVLTLPTQTEAKSGDFACKLTSMTLDVEHERKRVTKGHRYLKLAGSLTYHGKTVSAGFFGDRDFRLLVAGKPAKAVAYPIENLAPQVPIKFEAVYMVDAETKAVEFRMGAKDGAAARIVAELKVAKP